MDITKIPDIMEIVMTALSSSVPLLKIREKRKKNTKKILESRILEYTSLPLEMINRKRALQIIDLAENRIIVEEDKLPAGVKETCNSYKKRLDEIARYGNETDKEKAKADFYRATASYIDRRYNLFK